MFVRKSVSKKKARKSVGGKKLVLKKKLTLKRKIVKKIVRPTKKLVKKLIVSMSKPKPKKPVRLGKVVHYYNHIKVGIVKLSAPLLSGQKVQFKGVTTDFLQTVKSIQIDHVQVKKAAKGKVVGLKVAKRVRNGDAVFKA